MLGLRVLCYFWSLGIKVFRANVFRVCVVYVQVIGLLGCKVLRVGLPITEYLSTQNPKPT